MSESNTIVPVEEAIDRASGRSIRFLILAASVICLAVSLTFPFSTDARHWGAIFDLAHAPAFFFVFLLIAGVLDPVVIGLNGRLEPLVSLSVKRLVLLAVSLCVVGFVGEFAQSFVARSPSLLDMVANFTGLLAALFWCASRRIRRPGPRWMLGIIVPALVVAPGISSILELRECFLQRKDFPLLASFERSQELNAWYPHSAQVSVTSEWAALGKQSMRIDGKIAKRFPGAAMAWPIQDWSEYSQLRLDIYNPQDESMTVGINIADSDHAASGHEPSDRYQKSFEVAALSTETITIELSDIATAPLTRDMQMSRISLLDIFMPEADEATTIFVDNIRLTRSESR